MATYISLQNMSIPQRGVLSRSRDWIEAFIVKREQDLRMWEALKAQLELIRNWERHKVTGWLPVSLTLYGFDASRHGHHVLVRRGIIEQGPEWDDPNNKYHFFLHMDSKGNITQLEDITHLSVPRPKGGNALT